jgi:translation initiation factor 2B subunit (eIF-2B alpha/beta/delta family)
MESIKQRIARVRDDREHGSRWLVRETIMLLRDIASDSALATDKRAQQLWSAGLQLARARPAMAAVAGAVWRILGAPDTSGDIHSTTVAMGSIARAAEHLLQTYDSAVTHIVGYARPLLSGLLMTHSLSGTVLDVLCASQLDGVIVLEGRPRYEGRVLAESLSKVGIAVTLITDAQAAIFLPQCAAVVVGADSILTDGSILNKAGTSLLAWAARGTKKPFYVLSETLKIAPTRWTGNLEQLEEKEATEVLEQPIPGVVARNFYFDRTPGSLVTKLITEQGVLARSDVRRLASAVRQATQRAHERFRPYVEHRHNNAP